MTDHDDATVDASNESMTELPPPADPLGDARRELAEHLVEEARATGVSLVGPGGLLADITKRVAFAGPCKVTWREGVRRMIEERHPDLLKP